jgi:hypothetical protein
MLNKPFSSDDLDVAIHQTVSARTPMGNVVRLPAGSDRRARVIVVASFFLPGADRTRSPLAAAIMQL